MVIALIVIGAHRPARPDLHPDPQLDHRRRATASTRHGRDRRPAQAPPRPGPQPGRDGQGLRPARAADLREGHPGPRRGDAGPGPGPGEPGRGHADRRARRTCASSPSSTRAARDRELPAAARNLNELEDEIQASRRIYNSNVQAYNTKIQIFPNSVIANSGGFTAARVLRDRGRRRARAGPVSFTQHRRRRRRPPPAAPAACLAGAAARPGAAAAIERSGGAAPARSGRRCQAPDAGIGSTRDDRVERWSSVEPSAFALDRRLSTSRSSSPEAPMPASSRADRRQPVPRAPAARSAALLDDAG